MRRLLWQILSHLWAWQEARATRRRGVIFHRGTWGETWAARHLRLQGCTIIARNARPMRRGEVDLIARQGKTWLFIEVKTRKSVDFGRPLTGITPAKRQMMRASATHWLAQRGLLWESTPVRFDGVEVVGIPGAGVPQITWVKGLDMEATRAPDLYA